MKLARITAILFASVCSAQHTYRSPYLADPALLIGYVDSCAALWTKVYDSQSGGYYTNVGRTGNALNTVKHTMNHSRDAYGFIRAYQIGPRCGSRPGYAVSPNGRSRDCLFAPVVAKLKPVSTQTIKLNLVVP